MSGPGITFECPACGKTMLVARDPSDPPTATKATIRCGDCDTGDFDAPEYTDAEGRWVNPVEYLAALRDPASDGAK